MIDFMTVKLLLNRLKPKTQCMNLEKSVKFVA